MEPDDAHKACLKQKADLQRLELQWRRCARGEESTKLEQAVLDGLESPPGIKELEIDGYSGRECARWMQNHVGGGVQRLPYLPFLRVMKLYEFPNLKHLDGLAELPCLEELELWKMPSLESIIGGPFPSLVKLVMWKLPSLGEVWMVAEKSMPDGCNNCTPHLGQVLTVGSCVSNVDISDCPKLEVKPYLPLSLQHLELYRSNEQLLQSPCECNGSASSFSGFSHLKKLPLRGITGCGRGWELLQHMTALESLRILDCDELTELPECFWSLDSLQYLQVSGCSAICMLPESLGELQSLQQLAIMQCKKPKWSSTISGSSHIPPGAPYNPVQCISRIAPTAGRAPLSTPTRNFWVVGADSPSRIHVRLTSLEELLIWDCPGIKSLPEGIKGLTSLRKLVVWDCPDLHRRCKRRKGGGLASHLPHPCSDPFLRVKATARCSARC